MISAKCERANNLSCNPPLPEVDRFALLLHVKKHYPRIPFVFLTAILDAQVTEWRVSY
jgi:hypothetical protein